MEPILFVLTGPSGAGKGTVMRAMLERVPGLAKVVTYTTRAPRLGEVDGFDYHFLSVEQFLQLARDGSIYEYEQVYHDHYYGSPRDLFQPGHDGLIELDYKGHQKYRTRYSRVVSIFLLPPDMAELERRIVRRSEVSNLAARLQNAVDQLKHAAQYDYVVRNDSIDHCLERVTRIIETERIRRQGQADLHAIMQEVSRPRA